MDFMLKLVAYALSPLTYVWQFYKISFFDEKGSQDYLRNTSTETPPPPKFVPVISSSVVTV